jgi:citronellol/citronellal dehydrogenase
MSSLQGKTLVITGASRGIGLAIAKRAAADGANIVLLAKTVDPNPKLPGTLASAAAEVEAAGGQALAVQTDIRDDAAVSLRRWRRPWRVLAASTSWSTTPAPSA